MALQLDNQRSMCMAIKIKIWSGRMETGCARISNLNQTTLKSKIFGSSYSEKISFACIALSLVGFYHVCAIEIVISN